MRTRTTFCSSFVYQSVEPLSKLDYERMSEWVSERVYDYIVSWLDFNSDSSMACWCLRFSSDDGDLNKNWLGGFTLIMDAAGALRYEIGRDGCNGRARGRIICWPSYSRWVGLLPVIGWVAVADCTCLDAPCCGSIEWAVSDNIIGTDSVNGATADAAWSGNGEVMTAAGTKVDGTTNRYSPINT